MSTHDVHIRLEERRDHKAIFELIRAAFAEEPHSDKREHILVENLREKGSNIPELCLVAEQDGKVVGHLFTCKVGIRSPHNLFDALAIAPVTVLPGHQRSGIGSALIEVAISKAKSRGHLRMVLVGHEDYYPRFGFELATDHGVEFPFELPRENGFILGLNPGALRGVEGVVQYPKDFFE